MTERKTNSSPLAWVGSSLKDLKHF